MESVSKNVNETEEWIVANLQNPSFPISSLIGALELIRKDGRLDKADACAELLREALVQRKESDSAIAVLSKQASWHSSERDFPEKCEKALVALFNETPAFSRFISHSGFDKDTPAMECLRRFRVLLKLNPGTPCYDKTWGFGVVRELDDHMAKVTIDFKKKLQHKMSFAYAGEALQPLAESHVLAQHHGDPVGFARRVAEDPAGVVKAFIADFGPMNIVILQEMILENLESVKDWKIFWAKARKDLKKDQLVMLPAKRNEPIRVLDTKDSFDNHWIQSLQAERDAVRILDLIEDFRSSGSSVGMPDVLRRTIEERLAYAADGANGRNRPRIVTAARALLLAGEMGLTTPDKLKEALVERLLDSETLLHTMHKLPARSLNRLAPFLSSLKPGIFEQQLLELMPKLTFQDLNVVIESLLALGRQADVVSVLHDISVTGSASVDVVSWLCSHTDFVFKNGISFPDKLVFMALTAMEVGHFAGERIQARNKIRSCFQKDEWIKDIAGRMSDMQRRDLMLRLKASSAWQESERNMVLARIIQLFPDLRDDSPGAAPKIVRRRVTSLRSYAERQAALRKLIEVDVPKNIQDIAVARSFGDLSENYEYHAARETQGMLMARRKELEEMLNEVSGVSFENAPCDKVGEGTCVALRHEDGSIERYAILGEWDHDEKLSIISSSSGLARILEGKKAGEKVTIPRETGEALCVVAEITGLSDEIQQWVHAV